MEVQGEISIEEGLVISEKSHYYSSTHVSGRDGDVSSSVSHHKVQDVHYQSRVGGQGHLTLRNVKAGFFVGNSIKVIKGLVTGKIYRIGNITTGQLHSEVINPDNYNSPFNPFIYLGGVLNAVGFGLLLHCWFAIVIIGSAFFSKNWKVLFTVAYWSMPVFFAAMYYYRQSKAADLLDFKSKFYRIPSYVAVYSVTALAFLPFIIDVPEFGQSVLVNAKSDYFLRLFGDLNGFSKDINRMKVMAAHYEYGSMAGALLVTLRWVWTVHIRTKIGKSLDKVAL